MSEEVWKVIPEFPSYQISSLGRVYNMRRDRMMSPNQNNHGHVKINLRGEHGLDRHTRSVALLVGEAFVEKPDSRCNQVMMLDGDLSNVAATNLVWRPRWYAWKYVHQLRVPQPRHFHNLAVRNKEGVEYESIIEAGMTEGLMFSDIWESTYTGKSLYPYRQTFEVIERV